MSAAGIKAAMHQAERFETEPPRPLMRPLAAPEPFPVDALEGVLKGAADGIVDIVQVPEAMAAQSVLAAAALATQGLVNVELPTGQQRPLSCFFITVAGSGERKSASDRHATAPINDHEKELRKRYVADHADYEIKRESYDIERKRITSTKNRAEREQELDELGPPPSRLLEPVLTCPEPTIEGLHRLLAEGQPSIGLFSDEGGQFIAGHGMSVENRLKTAAALSCLWDGEPIKRVRGGDGVVILPGRRVSMHLMAQPDAAARWLADPVLADQGLLSRLLTVAPASLAGTRKWHEPDPTSTSALRLYQARLSGIFQLPLPMAEGVAEGLTPRIVTLSSDAARAWQASYDNIEGQLSANGALRPIMSLANKLLEHAARLATILALVEDINIQTLSLDHMERGIALAEHYASEALRLHGAAQISPALRSAERLLAWLQNSWDEPLISVVNVYQLGPRESRTKHQAEKLLGILEDHGWITRLGEGASIKGVKRRDVWQIQDREAT